MQSAVAERPVAQPIHPVSFRLPEVAVEQLKELTQLTGLAKSAVLTVAISQLYDREISKKSGKPPEPD